MMRRCVALIMLMAGTAVARLPDGTLWIIQTPNNGVPVLVTPGGVFEARLTQQAALWLTGPQGAVKPTVEWIDLPGAQVEARCTVPADAEPGCYALEAVLADGVDRNNRAVFVRPSFPEQYMFAHLTDTHIGRDPAGQRRASGTTPHSSLRSLLTMCADAKAEFVIVTGDLTHGGNPEEFRSFIEALDSCPLPTFVCAGNHDRQKLYYEQIFGPLVYSFAFGQDGYLVFDTKDFVTADELGEQDAVLELSRRALKPCRWTIGITHRYESNMGMRSQIALFVDNPLDYLLFGHRHRENPPEEKTVPWGTTPITVTPAAVDGVVRFVDVTSAGVRPRHVAYPVAGR